MLGLYETWVRQDEGLVIQLQYGSDRNFEKFTVGVKASKRGNDVYRWRVSQKLDLLKEALERSGIIVGKKTNALFITLTTNPILFDKNPSYAWKKIGERWNRFLSNIKRRYGTIQFVRSWESTEQGYPHVHALLVFQDSFFTTFQDKEGRMRVEEKEGLARFWDSFVDVQAPRSVQSAQAYIIKEVLKHGFDVKEDSKTLALLWVFEKRAFSMSKGLASLIKRLDESMHNSNSKARSLDLFGLPIDELKGARWVFVGVFSWSEILAMRKDGQKNGLWSYELRRPPPGGD